MSKINWSKLPKDYTSTDLSNLLKESGVDPNNWLGSNQSIPELDMLSKLEKNFIAAFKKADYPKLETKPVEDKGEWSGVSAAAKSYIDDAAEEVFDLSLLYKTNAIDPY